MSDGALAEMIWHRPETEADLAQCLRQSRAPLQVQGGGTRGAFAPMAAGLDLRALTGVRLYEPAALTVVLGAGTPLVEVEALLAAEGQRLAFEPPDYRGLLGRTGASTIGGVLAANAAGPRRLLAGAARDSALGVRFVTGAGEIAANGGRVMKNVTGYDLVKLFSGAQGRLGVLTEVSLRVQSRAEAEVTLIWDAVPSPMDLLQAALSAPWEVSGAAFVPDPSGGWQVFLRLEGFAEALVYRQHRMAERLSHWGMPREATDGPAQWRALRDLEALKGCDLVVQLSLRASATAGVLAALGPDLAVGRVRMVADWGGGRLSLGVGGATGAVDLAAWVLRLREMARRVGGHATLLKADLALHQRFGTWGRPAEGVAQLEAGLRRAFDPEGRLQGGVIDADAVY